MSWYSFRPYVSVAARKANARREIAKLQKGGRRLDPVVIEGRAIAHTFWGKAWCDNLESYSDYENRLPRGRTYARNGSVIDLQIAQGKVTALVQGSSLYEIEVEITPLSPERWKSFVQSTAGKISHLLELLQGRLPQGVLTLITDRKEGLFPSPTEIKLGCSCPDWADMCKHVAAVLYGVGARLDSRPELLFTLRGVQMQDLISAASVQASAPMESAAGDAVAPEDLSAIFGVEIESAPLEAPAPVASKQPKVARKPLRKKTSAPIVSPPKHETKSKKKGGKVPKKASVPARKTAVKPAGKKSLKPKKKSKAHTPASKKSGREWIEIR
jgi:uncharacterized Zn finger protein